MYDRSMVPIRLFTVAVLLAAPVGASAEPLAPVAPNTAVLVVPQPTSIQDEPRIMLARADDPAPGKEAPRAPARGTARGATPNPFASLKVLVPRAKLPPLKSVRTPSSKDNEGKKEGTITVKIGSSPSGASISYGGKSLGATPLFLEAPRGSIPYNIVIRARGRMTLRTRIHRDVDREYYYRMHPAKIR